MCVCVCVCVCVCELYINTVRRECTLARNRATFFLSSLLPFLALACPSRYVTFLVLLSSAERELHQYFTTATNWPI